MLNRLNDGDYEQTDGEIDRPLGALLVRLQDRRMLGLLVVQPLTRRDGQRREHHDPDSKRKVQPYESAPRSGPEAAHYFESGEQRCEHHDRMVEQGMGR